MTAGPKPGWQTLPAELKRRRVLHLMAVYGVVGFGGLQAVDLLVPVLLLPKTDEVGPAIAVLPFTNVARGPDPRPFVDGVHDDLPAVASIPPLRRTE